MEDFIKNELKILEDSCTDEESLNVQKIVTKNILDIYNVFKSQRHSGFSASYTINLLEKLLRYIPITPLTGNNSEWNKIELEDDIYYQNKRCPQIFKDKEGKAYNVEGKAFSDDNGHTWYTNADSRVYITFPYTVPLTPEYIIIDNDEQRKNILSQLLQIAQDLKICKIEDITKVDENFYVKDIILEKDFDIYMNEIIKQYGISNSLKIDNDTYIWSLITFVLHNI